MTMRSVVLTLALIAAARVAAAQQPPIRLDDQPRSVTMSLAEYNRLLDLAARAPVAPVAAPVAAVVSSADMRITVDRETAHGVFAIAGQVLRSGVNRVALLSGATVSDANAGGRPVPLVAEGQILHALVPGPGPFALSLDWGAPLAFRPGRASFALPVPHAGAARATIDLPGEQADVRLSAGLITRRSFANGRTLIEATLDPGSITEVWWSMRDTSQVAAVKEVRALAEIFTLFTLDDGDVRMTALIDVIVTQGELRTLKVNLPQGYELQSVTGHTLESSAEHVGEIVLTIGDPAARSHQFLVTLERPHAGGTFTVETGLVSLDDVQRERGEIGVEGVGTMDLASADRAGLHRIDVRELSGSLHALARVPILSAFRYQRPAGAAPPHLALTVRRFADASVLAAIADHATATTLITSEGRALTEIQLEMRNRSQPFLKIDLPPGATIVSVDLAGQAAKPATGADGTRIPLMRAGLSTASSYQVSFVYVHAGTPFEKKGEIEMTLPKMDVPVGMMRWEVFVPEQYKARAIDGNVIDIHRFPTWSPQSGYIPVAGPRERVIPARMVPPIGVAPGQLRGRVVDSTGAVIPGATLRLTVGRYAAATASAENGEFVFAGVPHGQAELTSELAGFATQRTTFALDGRPRRIEIQLAVATVSETVTVSSEAALIDTDRPAPPSPNVVNLQARAAGVLPIRVDVPRAGVSHEFVKPLVVGDRPTVRLRYKRN